MFLFENACVRGYSLNQNKVFLMAKKKQYSEY